MSTDAIILAAGLGAIFIVVIIVIVAHVASKPQRARYRDTAARVRDRNRRKSDGGRHGK